MQPLRILLVEDDEVDREAVRRGLRAKRIANELIEATNGQEALAIIRGENGRTPLEQPFIVLLDINMPVMNGFEFLDALRADPELVKTVVFILTTSEAGNDVFDSYRRNVAGYLIKSRLGDSFVEAIELIDHYWRIVEMPG
jgi:CheY-like chemotaxis protein